MKKKKVMLQMLAATIAASMIVPVGTLAMPNTAVVAYASQEVSTKTAPKITGVLGSEASSWSPATLTLTGLSRYDDTTSTWLDAITEVNVNGDVYTRADNDSLNSDDTKKYAMSYLGMNLIAGEIKDGDNTIVIKATGYKEKEVVVTKGKDDTGATSYTLKSQKNGGVEVSDSELDKTLLENAIIDAKALKQGDQSDERWIALQEAIKVAEEALASAATQEDISTASEALNKAIKDFGKTTKGPTVEKVYYNDWSKCLEISALGKTYTDDDYIDNIANVVINGVEYSHGNYDVFDEDESVAAKQYVFSYGAMQIGLGAFKDGDNVIEITSNGYDKKTINFTKNGDTYTFVSQTDGDKTAGLQNPTEDGVYTVTFSAKKEDSEEDSMIGSYFDKRAKVTVENGKMKISFLNVAMKSFLLDFSVDSKGEYQESTRKDYGDKNAGGEYDYQEFTLSIDDLTTSHKAAALVTAMGGQASDIHDWTKYIKADITFESVTKGWEGYQKEIDDAGKLIGSELTEKVLVDAGYDTDGDGKMSKEELQNISGELDLSGQNLTDISILKDLSDKVTTLNLSSNKIKEIPAGLLDNMTNLLNFYIEYNFVSEIPDNLFANNKKLDWISFASNNLKEIKDNQVSDLPALTILDLSSNEISSISADAFKGLTKLNDLGLMENDLTDLPDGLFKPMSGSLESLSMYDNLLTEIPEAIMDAESLTSFSAFANNIKDISNISFDKFKKLKTLNLQYNEISKIGEKAFASNDNLNALDLYDNCLTDFSVDALPKGKVLQKLDLRLNNIKVINPELRSHAQSYNKFNPQKSVTNLKVTNDGVNGIKWTQDFSTLDLIFWLDQTMSDRTVEIQSVDEYKEMLKTNGWDDQEISKVLDDNGYDWTIITEVQKKNADGTYTTVWDSTIENEKEVTNGTYKTTEYGTYRVVKTLYTTFNSFEQYRTTLYSNDYNFTKQEQPTTPETPVVKVATPVAFKANATAYNKAKLSWKGTSGATGYEVYQYNTKTKKYEKIKAVKTTSYMVSGLATGTSYKFKVRAYKTVNGKNVYSAYTSTASVKTTLKTASSVKASSAAYNKVKLSWKKVDGATGYEVYQYNAKTKKYTKTATVKTTSYTKSKLTTGTSYKFKVRAYRTVNGKKVYSSYSKVVSAKPSLAKVSSVSAKNVKTKSVKLSWKKVSGATGYQVYQYDTKAKKYTKVATVKTTSYTKAKLKTGSKYTFKVRAYKTVSKKNVYGSYSAKVSVKVTK